MGNGFTFMHCADLHLGSRFVGVTDDDPVLGKRMRASPMESFERIVDAAIDGGADFMVVSGDLYDEANVLPSVRLALCTQFSRFGKPVFIARGNHDSETSWNEAIPYPDNVYEFPIMPSSYHLDIRGNEVEVVGVSFEGSHDDRNLVSMLRGSRDAFTIGCVHCDVDPSDEGSRYAPCRSSDLKGRNIDYWALGHIHKRSIACKDPPAIYPGCIQGRSMKESGQKGAYMVTVDDGRISLRFVPTQSILWKALTVDITGMGMQDLVVHIKSEVPKGSMMGLHLVGSGEIDGLVRSERDDFIKAVESATGSTVYGLRVDSAGTVDLESLSGREDMCGKLAQVASDMRADRRMVLDAICANPVAGRYRSHFEDMDDAEIDSIVESALRRLVSGMVV